MQMLSPVDALSPAFRRMREVLVSPFRLGFFLKIAFVAALTQPNFYSMMISVPMQAAEGAASGAMHSTHRITSTTIENFQNQGAIAGVTLFFVVIAAVIGLAFWIVLAYIFCRLRFTLFDLVLYRHGSIREGWSKYGRQTWRYFGVTILIGLAFLVLIAATVGPVLLHLVRTIASQGQNADPTAAMAQLFPMMGMFLILAVLGAVIDAVLQDFILPPMAMEDASIEGSFGRFFSLLRENPGSVLAYIALRFVVALGISWVLMIVVFVVLGILAIGGFLAGMLLYHAMWHGSVGMRAAFVAIAVAMGLVLAVLYLLAVVAIYGTVAVFKQSYMLYFFGPRYPALGNQVEPPVPEEPAVWDLPQIPPLQEPPPVW